MNNLFLTAYSLVATAGPGLSIDPVVTVAPDGATYATIYVVPVGGLVKIPKSCLPATVFYSYRDSLGDDPEPVRFECGVDFDGDGSCGTDADIDAFFAAYVASDDGQLGGADWDENGVVDWRDVSAFFASLAGG